MSYFPNPYEQGEATLSQPLYGATIKQAFVRFWKKYVVFSGRASRSEYWWWALISFVISFILSAVDRLIFGEPTATSQQSGAAMNAALLSSLRTGIFSNLWALATLVGGLSLVVRRLHDRNKSGWTFLFVLIPFVGAFILLYFLIGQSRPEGQRFDV